MQKFKCKYAAVNSVVKQSTLSADQSYSDVTCSPTMTSLHDFEIIFSSLAYTSVQLCHLNKLIFLSFVHALPYSGVMCHDLW